MVSLLWGAWLIDFIESLNYLLVHYFDNDRASLAKATHKRESTVNFG